MMTTLQRVAVSAIAMAISCTAFSLAQTCNDQGCAPVARWVVDHPAGRVNGANLAFELEYEPLNGTATEVFRNGLRLRDQDFRVDGRILYLFGGQTPQPGDRLLAKYLAIPVGKTVSSNSHPLRKQIDADILQDEATIAAGREALALEERGITKTAQLGRGVYPQTSLEQKTETLRSSAIEMLVSKARGGNSVSSSRIHADFVGNVEGVDGLGDVQSSSVIRGFRSNELVSDKSRSGNEQNMPASVRMIINRSAAGLEDSSINDDLEEKGSKKHSKGSKKKEHVHSALQWIAR